MKTRHLAGITLLAVMMIQGAASGQVYIESFTTGGKLVASGMAPGTTSKVEWASSSGGPWSNWVSTVVLDSVTVDSNGMIRVNTPMFFRVKGISTTTTSSSSTSTSTTTTSSTTTAPAPIAEYTFSEGSGSVVHDTSGVEPAMDLSINNESYVTWLNGALRLDLPRAILTSPDKKIFAACQLTGELTISAWIQTSTLQQDGPARVVTFSSNIAERNFTLGQEAAEWNMRVRTTDTNLYWPENGMCALKAPIDSTALAHVVYTRAANGEEYLYVDGVRQSPMIGDYCWPQVAGVRGGDFSNWDSSYGFALGNELSTSSDRQFYGAYHRVSIYSTALPPQKVESLFDNGP